MKFQNIKFLTKDSLTDDVDGYFILPTLYFNQSKMIGFGMKIYFISVIWLRFVRTTQITFYE